ncbi:hypothetical protein ADUPG1_005016, partial [Aduncisulcus paluster]
MGRRKFRIDIKAAICQVKNLFVITKYDKGTDLNALWNIQPIHVSLRQNAFFESHLAGFNEP